MKKKTLTIAIALVLVVALAVGATWAYLKTSTGPVVNTFTVGKVLDNNGDLTWKVLDNDTVKVADEITSANLGTLTFNAYLVQAGDFASAAAAWNAAKLDTSITAA